MGLVIDDFGGTGYPRSSKRLRLTLKLTRSFIGNVTTDLTTRLSSTPSSAWYTHLRLR